jgi:hypothetical protein
VFTNMRVSKESGISAAGEAVTVTVKTNVPTWWARVGTSPSDNKAGTGPSANAGDVTVQVPIPARPVTSSAAWSDPPTTYTLYAGYAAFTVGTTTFPEISSNL